MEVVAHPTHLFYERMSLGVERVPTNKQDKNYKTLTIITLVNMTFYNNATTIMAFLRVFMNPHELTKLVLQKLYKICKYVLYEPGN